MVDNNTGLNDLILSPDAVPDLHFTLFDPEQSITYNYTTDKNNNKLVSVGNIQSVFEAMCLLEKSLKIVSPHVVFSPDFPDYMLDRDDPKYVDTNYPSIEPRHLGKLPHHRSDLYARNYDYYKTIDKIPSPHITWGTVRQECGGTEPFRGTQERKPRLRNVIGRYAPTYRTYDNGSKELISKYGEKVGYYEIKGQTFDTLIQFNMWARTSWEAEELTEWFEEYLRKYTGMFREAGILQMWYDRRVRDDKLTQIKNKYHVRSFLYYVRTERIDISTINPIKRIEARFHVNAGGINTNFLNSDNNVAIDFDDKLLRKWHNEHFQSV